MTATDISQGALNIASENARFHNVENKITFLKSNLFESLAICDMRYAICVSNPPYVPTLELNELQPEIQYEPRIALDGGEDGLDFYRHLIAQSRHYLKRNGLLILEMGYNQKNAIENLFQKSECFEIMEVVKLRLM